MNINIPYAQVAKDALVSWNGFSEEEALKIVKESSMEELEAKTYATDSINSGISAMSNNLGLNEQETQDLSESTFGGTKDDTIFSVVGKKIESKDLDSFILDTLSTIHDEWVKKYDKNFFKEGRNKQYQHLPLELIGWKEAKSDLLFLKPILEASGIEFDEKSLEEAYNKRREEFLKEHEIDSEKALKEKISQGSDFYPALEGTKADGEMRNNPDIRDAMITQMESRDLLPEEKITPKQVEQATQNITINNLKNGNEDAVNLENNPNKDNDGPTDPGDNK